MHLPFRFLHNSLFVEDFDLVGEPFNVERKEEGFHHLDSCSRVSDRIAASGSVMAAW